MRKSRCQDRAQFLLALEPQSLRVLPASNPSGLLEALAELLLEAVGTAEQIKTGGADEQQDHR